MSLRTYQRIAIMGALALGATCAVGCGDDNKKKPEIDAGSGDGDGDGMMMMPMSDGGTKDKNPKSATCGGTVCEGQMLLGMYPVDACCAGEAQDKCGYLGNTFPPPASLDGCLERDAPGKESVDVCGSFFDQVETAEGSSNTDKMLYVKGDTVSLSFPGCCTPEGMCGASLSKPAGSLGSLLDLHLGCVPYTTLASSLGSGDAGAPDPSTLEILPFCNPETGGPKLSGSIPGAPTFICGCGEDKKSPGADGLPCLNHTGTDVCGADGAGTAIYTGSLAMIPEFICGATGSTSALPVKLKNVDSTVCGSAPVNDGTSSFLDNVPAFFCGAIGAPATANPAFLLPNVENTICGKLPVTAESTEVLAGIPEFLCGATGAPAGVSGLLLLPNVDYSVCGKAPVDADSKALLSVPEFMCGATGAPAGVSVAFKLPNVEYAVCGKAPITADSQVLAAVPEFICGAIGAPAGVSAAMLLPNVETAVCGKMNILAGSPYLGNLPEFMCGCGDDQQTGTPASLPCLRNVTGDACGATPINEAALGALIPTLPETVCGCGDNVKFSAGLPCLNNLDLDVCGPQPVTVEGECVPGYPANVNGCGEDTAWPEQHSCIPNVADKPGCIGGA
ncbi:MAG: hypothetical protein QM778_14055 [Myxococcales bacterium]